MIEIRSNAIAAMLYMVFFFFVYAKELWFWKFKFLIYLVAITALTLGSYIAVLAYPRRKGETRKSSSYCYICRDGRPQDGIHCPLCKFCVNDFSEHSKLLEMCIRKDQRVVYVLFKVILYVLHVTLVLFQWMCIVESLNSNPKQKSARSGVLLASIGCMSGLAICFPVRLYSVLLGKAVFLFVCLWTGVAKFSLSPIRIYILASIPIALLPFNTLATFPYIAEVPKYLQDQYKTLLK